MRAGRVAVLVVVGGTIACAGPLKFKPLIPPADHSDSDAHLAERERQRQERVRAHFAQQEEDGRKEAESKIREAHALLDGRPLFYKENGWDFPGMNEVGNKAFKLANEAATLVPHKTGARLVHIRLAVRGMFLDCQFCPGPECRECMDQMAGWLEAERKIRPESPELKITEQEWAEFTKVVASAPREPAAKVADSKPERCHDDPDDPTRACCTKTGRGGRIVSVPAGKWQIDVTSINGDRATVHVCEGKTSCERGGEEITTPGTIAIGYDFPVIVSCRAQSEVFLQVVER